MNSSLDTANNKDNMGTHNAFSLMSTSILGKGMYVKPSKYGFEIFLPNNNESTLEVPLTSHLLCPIKQIPNDSFKQVDLENISPSNIDFNEIDSLFNKLKNYNGKLASLKRFNLSNQNTNLEKRPPIIENRRLRSKDSADTSTVVSTCSYNYGLSSGSTQAATSKTVQLSAVKRDSTAGTNRRHRDAAAYKKTSCNNKDDEARIPASRRPRSDLGEWILVDFVKKLIFGDEVNSEIMKKFDEMELEIAQKIIRLRYKGATEKIKYSTKSKNFSAFNTRCNFRFVNEKKLLGDIWPFIIDNLKKSRSLWQTDKEQEIIQLFRTFHKSIFLEPIRKGVDKNLSEQLKRGNDALLINLFSELYLGYRQ